MKACHEKSFEQSMEIQFVGGLEILNDGMNAYNMFKDKCENGEMVNGETNVCWDQFLTELDIVI